MKILLIQFKAIGDVLMCTPAIRFLREKFQNAIITFLVNDYAFDAIRYNPNIDNFIIFKRKMKWLKYIQQLLKLGKYNFDIVIDFHRNPRASIATLFTGAKKRISFKEKHRNFIYNITIEPPDESTTYAAIKKLQLLQPFGISEQDDFLPELYITEKEKKWANNIWNILGFKRDDLVIAISPVSPRPYKIWPSDNFVQLCDYLIDKYEAKIIFTWGPGEYHIIKSILQKMRNQLEINYEISSILQVKALYEKCSLYIGNDNGQRHIAITADIPTIGIFDNPQTCYHWLPPDNTKHRIIYSSKKGIQNVSLENVIKSVDNIILDIE